MSNLYPFGQCTWWSANEEPWVQRYGNLGNAKDWAANWRAKGGFVTSRPAIGDVACFQPNVDGADAVFGHVAVVVAISGAFFTVSEMNGPAGPGRTDDRVCRLASGVSFLAQFAPVPPSKPSAEDPRMFTIINFGAPGTYIVYDDHVLVGIDTGPDVGQMQTLPQCHGVRTLQPAMLARFQAVAPKP